MRAAVLALLGLAAVTPDRAPVVELPQGSTVAIVRTDAVRVALGTPDRHRAACRWADAVLDEAPSCSTAGAVSETVWRVVHARGR